MKLLVVFWRVNVVGECHQTSTDVEMAGGAPSACAACPRSVSQVRNPGSQRDDDSGSTGRLGMLLDRLDRNKGEWQLARRGRF